jgi:dolichol-phosphate mannosyltransferase
MKKHKSISIIVPVFNEAKNIELLYSELTKILSTTGYNFEIIFVNDGSKDKSQEKLEKLKKEDNRVKLLNLTRNFGKELATTAGINNCQGDACIIIDADLQHPPALIPKFIEKWEEGSSVVIGVRKSNKGEGLTKKVGSVAFYKIINRFGPYKN